MINILQVCYIDRNILSLVAVINEWNRSSTKSWSSVLPIPNNDILLQFFGNTLQHSVFDLMAAILEIVTRPVHENEVINDLNLLMILKNLIETIATMALFQLRKPGQQSKWQLFSILYFSYFYLFLTYNCFTTY